jgi:HK97 gp10 family phage protein
MGKFDFEVSQDFLKALGRLADVDRFAPKMIDESMPILADHLKDELKKHRRTSDMLDSVKKTKAGKGKNGGYYAVVRPTGRDKKGVRNMEKLAWLEYGTKKQTPTPILTKAIKDSQSAVEKKMQEVFEREVGK